MVAPGQYSAPSAGLCRIGSGAVISFGRQNATKSAKGGNLALEIGIGGKLAPPEVVGLRLHFDRRDREAVVGRDGDAIDIKNAPLVVHRQRDVFPDVRRQRARRLEGQRRTASADVAAQPAVSGRRREHHILRSIGSKIENPLPRSTSLPFDDRGEGSRIGHPGRQLHVAIGSRQIQDPAKDGIILQGCSATEPAGVPAALVPRIVLKLVDRRPVVRVGRPVIVGPGERRQVEFRPAERVIPGRILARVIVMVRKRLRGRSRRRSPCVQGRCTCPSPPGKACHNRYACRVPPGPGRGQSHWCFGPRARYSRC